ncbi:MAG: type IV pilus twitching motility protein PilT [Elusimicrobiota bacterium]
MPTDVVRVLGIAVARGASDIHLSANRAPILRINGELVDLADWPALDSESCKEMVYSLLGDQQRARLETDLELDCSVSVAGLGRFRANVLLQRGNVECALRAVPSRIPTPEALGLGPAAMGLAALPRGLVLVTGPTGSGKSTTLACMIDHINATSRRHILTIEDPIEFVYPRNMALIRQREVGSDTKSFGEALRRALREDPDVILLGEMRDRETIALALTAAETGHLCFSTLHTLGAADTLDRIIDVFPSAQQDQIRIQLSGVLKGVISQILLPRREGAGRIAARELMLVNSAVANQIREGKTHLLPNTIATSGALGMFTLDRSLAALVARGAVGLEDALARARDPEALAAACQKQGVLS